MDGLGRSRWVCPGFWGLGFFFSLDGGQANGLMMTLSLTPSGFKVVMPALDFSADDENETI